MTSNTGWVLSFWGPLDFGGALQCMRCSIVKRGRREYRSGSERRGICHSCDVSLCHVRLFIVYFFSALISDQVILKPRDLFPAASLLNQ